MVALWQPRLLLLVNESSYFLTHRLNIARAARAAGFQVHVATKVVGDVAEIEQHGVRVHPIDFPRNVHGPLIEWRAVRQLTHLYRQVQPDVIHHFSAKGVLLGALAARRTGARNVVNTFTGLGAAFSGTGWRARCRQMVIGRIMRQLLLNPDWRTTFQNPEDMWEMIRARIVPVDGCRLIRGSGVDCTQFRPQETLAESLTLKPQIVLPARMIWSKGVGEFVEAARYARRLGTQAEWVLVGGTDPENPAAIPERLLHQWTNEGIVQWRGHHQDMVSVLNRATVVVLPTYAEGCPKVLLEAAACARPIVATNVRGCREIVEHRRNGLLVPARDPQALAHAVHYLVNEPWVCLSMGIQGRKMMLEQFTAERIARQTITVYREMVGWPDGQLVRHAA